MVVEQGVVVTVKPLQNILVVVHTYLTLYAEVLPTANDDSREKYHSLLDDTHIPYLVQNQKL